MTYIKFCPAEQAWPSHNHLTYMVWKPCPQFWKVILDLEASKITDVWRDIVSFLLGRGASLVSLSLT